MVHRLAAAVRGAVALARPAYRAAVLLGVYIYLAWMPYSSEILGFLHMNPRTRSSAPQETNFMSSLLF